MTAVFAVEEGPPDGPPILLLHGFASSHHAWDRLLPLLDGFRVVRVDLLGHGRTGGQAADAAHQAAAVAALLVERDVARLTVIGHSFGADVAVALARDPKVSRVVVLTQGPDYGDARVPRVRFLTSRPRLTRRLHAALRPVLIVGGGLLGASHRLWPALLARVLRDAAHTDPGMLPIVLTDRRETLARDPLDLRLGAAGKPSLVVLGSRDRLYGDRSAARYRAAGAHVEIVAAGTHALPQQYPAAVADALRRFIG